MLFGFELQTIYLTVLIVFGCLTILYILFSDMLEGVFEGIPYIEPAVLLAFITMFSASAYLLEKFSPLSSMFVVFISSVLSAIFSTLIYFFILLPIKSAEVSLAYTDESLGGQVGRVIVPIPINGYGEIVIETAGGVISKRAAGFDNEEIDYDEQVLIIEVKEGTVYVKKYHSPMQYQQIGGV